MALDGSIQAWRSDNAPPGTSRSWWGRGCIDIITISNRRVPPSAADIRLRYYELTASVMRFDVTPLLRHMNNPKTSRQRRGHFGEKADFIRSQPGSMSAKEIVEAAAKHGLKISANHVYNLRAVSAKGQAGGKENWRLGSRHSDVVYPARLVETERKIRAAIAEIGLSRARQIFDDVADVF